MTDCIRAAAYCRVSTDREDQIHSLESQQRYFRSYIEEHPGWKLSRLYVDEGVTGTSAVRRKGFRSMLEDAGNHQFDLLLTKEISRFARNTLDSIRYTRWLKERGIGVLFLNDGICTLDADAELRLTILASIAQEESRRTSERVRWGQKRSMEQGTVFGSRLLGYEVEKGRIRIREEEAETVRQIFRKFLEEGKGAERIAKELEQMGVPTSAGRFRWSGTAVLRILRNEKYTGDLIQGKTYTEDYLSHHRKINRGERELVAVRNHHPPVIDRETFQRTAEELERRGGKQRQGSRYSGRYPLSGKLYCGFCGRTMVPHRKHKPDGTVLLYWRCAEAARHGRKREEDGRIKGCDGRLVRDDFLRARIQEEAEPLLPEPEDLKAFLLPLLRDSMTGQSVRLRKEREARLAFLGGQEERLLDYCLEGELGPEEYRERKEKIQKERERLERESRMTEEEREERFRMAAERAGEAAEEICREKERSLELVEKVIIYGREETEIYWKQEKG